MPLTVGSMCSGYEGLGLGLAQVLDTETAWVSEVDPSACAILDARLPGVPNIGDLTVLDWSTVEPVDVLTAGYPCQPFSTAGRRQGANDARHLWPFIADAVGVLRPQLVVLENVAGHLSMGATAVLGDLARLGYDARWCVVRASDVGACHRRARLFIVAHPQHPDSGGCWPGWIAGMGRSLGVGRDDPRVPATIADAGADVSADADRGRRHGYDVPEPSGRCQLRDASCGDSGAGGVQAIALRPFPSRLVGVGSRESGWEGSKPAGRRDVLTGCGGESAADADADADDLGPERNGHARGRGVGPAFVDWGAYGRAVARHAVALGRAAPNPVDAQGRLNPPFVEWMMMLPAGWVTDVVGVRSKALRCLGNGVVPPQAAYAIRRLLS